MNTTDAPTPPSAAAAGSASLGYLGDSLPAGIIGDPPDADDLSDAEIAAELQRRGIDTRASFQRVHEMLDEVISGQKPNSPMTAKDYCSRICGAKCCKAHAPIVWPPRCPKLTADNLCSIYETRIGFRFNARDSRGGTGTCVCSPVETFVKILPPEVRAQCCFVHPELLQNSVLNEPTSLK